MTHYAKNMYDFHTWANQTLINRLKELPEGVYEQEVQSVFPTVAKVVEHIYMVDQGWLHILQGMDMRAALNEAWKKEQELTGKSLEEVEQMYAELVEQYRVFLSQEEDLDRHIVLDNPYTRVRDTSLAEIIMQVVNHGTYHRGNITAMLRQMGYPSVMTEYALYWYET
ncbi:damage-inducible protein DinB [Brevibacillus sp. HB1.1]|uniref:DinB family protein n=1 Tax=unclassified Brevibacillus TaxID=2684853 RepID=UPI000853E291|nr:MULTISPECIES: DinB family protein [unclassified Brevibacillus]MDC0764706.1 DinB family protein [Brevibacillus sp. AG]NTU34042.1 damage-inducible protein DinB [Brevibacillus sp. HB1.1]